jgi:N-acetylglucosamine-6-phosphate deacetylase
MSEVLVHNARVVLPNGIVHGGIVARQGRIAEVFAESSRPTGFGSEESIDAGQRHLAPGFIDIHIHGSAGIDVQDTDEAGLSRISRFLLGKGVMGYFPTFVPADSEAVAVALGTINSYVANLGEAQKGGARWNRAIPGAGARVLGVHFEGPFVSKKRCGALHTEHFRTYDGDPRSVDIFTRKSDVVSENRVSENRVSEDLPGAGRLMTIAPEVDGSLALIHELTGSGVRCFIGHSIADPPTLDLAAEAGARHMTHFPNALEPLHHRKPGAVAWGLVRQDITMDCIADFEHIDPLMLQLMYQAKGAARMSLISDAIKPAGLGDGVYDVWGDRISVTGGRTSLASDEAIPIEQRTIAGSVITLDKCVKNMLSLGVPVHEAVGMATLAPARASGVDAEYGSIEVGKRADLILFDEDLSGVQPAFIAMD